MMSITNFRAYLDHQAKKQDGKGREKLKGKGKKRAQPISSEESDDDMHRKKAKGKARHHSSDLDGSSDE